MGPTPARASTLTNALPARQPRLRNLGSGGPACSGVDSPPIPTHPKCPATRSDRNGADPTRLTWSAEGVGDQMSRQAPSVRRPSHGYALAQLTDTECIAQSTDAAPVRSGDSSRGAERMTPGPHPGASAGCTHSRDRVRYRWKRTERTVASHGQTSLPLACRASTTGPYPAAVSRWRTARTCSTSMSLSFGRPRNAVSAPT
jgi:hypothetical protein